MLDTPLPSPPSPSSPRSAARASATATDAALLIVPGLHDSGEAHWQTHWQASEPEALRVRQDDWHVPDLDAWARRVAEAVARCASPPIVAAHSFGCLAVAHAVRAHGAAIAAALLVAPADPEKFGIAPACLALRLPFPSTLVASTNDPWLKVVRAGALARTWGSALIAYRDAGHINAESGYGRWPGGRALLRDLQAAVRHRAHRAVAGASAASAARPPEGARPPGGSAREAGASGGGP